MCLCGCLYLSLSNSRSAFPQNCICLKAIITATWKRWAVLDRMDPYTHHHTSVIGLREIWLKNKLFVSHGITRGSADYVWHHYIWKSVCSRLTEQMGESISTREEGQNIWNMLYTHREKCWMGYFKPAGSFIQLGHSDRRKILMLNNSIFWKESFSILKWFFWWLIL